MKIIAILVLILSIAFGCRDQKNVEEKMIPVESDGGIGDGAPPLDSLIDQQEKNKQVEQLKDSL
tara:strand:+ start:157 stop:348 length:192 start_codon:yes stop_codon:yes gene_type:complete